MKIFQDADPFVPLQDIEPVHIFVGNDRISDALIKVIPDDAIPFSGEFTVVRHQGHKIGRKGSLPSGCLGSDDLFERDADQAKGFFRPDIAVVDNLIQCGKIRIFSTGQRLPVSGFPALECSAVFLRCHSTLPPGVF